MGEVYNLIKSLSGQSSFEFKVRTEYDRVINEMANNAKRKVLKVEFENRDVGYAIFKLLRQEGFVVCDTEISENDTKIAYKIYW